MRMLMALALVLVAAGEAPAAAPLDERFQRLARQAAAGIGGYTGTVEPIKGTVKLAYGPTLPRGQRFTTLVSTRGALVRILVEATLSRQATAAGLLMSVSTLDDFAVEHLIAADGVTITHQSLPRRTTVLMATDHRGAIRDAVILPPPDNQAAAMPQPGTRGFVEALNRFPLPVLVTETAVQDSDIFLPITFPLGGGAGIDLVRGTGPRLRGAVACPKVQCLLIHVDEETLFSAKTANGAVRSVRATALGHLVVRTAPVDVVSGLLSLRTEIREAGRTEVIRSILVNEPAREKN